MKIGMFSDSYLPYTSGVVRSIESFKNQLTLRGNEVYIFAPKYNQCPKDPKVFRFVSLPSPTNKNFNLAVPFSFRLWHKVKELNLDLIHVHSPFLLGHLGARWAKKLDIPLVFTYHTLYEQYVHYIPMYQSLTRNITKKITADFCNQCDLVITPTNIIANYLKQSGVKTRVKTVPTGIQNQDFQYQCQDFLQKKFSISPEDKILLFVGRLGKEKNISFLIESFKLIINSYPNTRLIIVGDGPEEAHLKKEVANYFLENKIFFTGRLSEIDVIKSYNSADLFVFASLTETQGLVIGEAKAAGLPVVAVDAFGVSEMVIDKEDGLLTSPDVAEFSKCVLLLLKDKALYNKMKKTSLMNAQRLSASSCTNRLLEAYQEVIKNYYSKPKKMYS